MKKRNATALSEILYQDINVIGDNVENFQQYLFQKVLGVSSGMVLGLVTSIATSGTISVASGSMVDVTYSYGELEGTSGVTVSIPVSGTRTDTVSAKFLEVADTPGASYVLIDVESRTQTTTNVYRRKFGSIVVENSENTASGALTGNRVPIASLTVTSGGIQAVTDLRVLIKTANADTSAITLAGDVTGTAAATVVAKIQGIAVDTTDPTNGQVLQYNSTSGKYVPTSPAAAVTEVTMGGDVSGLSSDALVTALSGVSLTGTLSAGQAYVFDGVNLVATTVPTGTISTAGVATFISGADTTTTITMGSTFTLDIAIGQSGKTFGHVWVTNNVDNIAHILVTNTNTDALAAFPYTVDQSSPGIIQEAGYDRGVGVGASGTRTAGDGVYLQFGSEILLQDIYITGTNLRLVFRNTSGGSTRTLKAKVRGFLF